MDLRMPDLDGPGGDAGRSSKRDPSTRVAGADRRLGRVPTSRLRSSRGRCGYLLKDSPIDDVVEAVRAAARGVAWLSPRAAEALLDRIRRDYVEPGPASSSSRISPRASSRCSSWWRAGLDNGEIATELSISPRTAKNHVSSILSKLEVPNRIQAATYAVRTGLV